MRTGAENKGVEWKKMGGWDVYHTLGFEIQLCEFETILCGFETTLCGLEKKKGIENELCSFENYLGGIGKQLCGFEMTCWALCGVETTQVKLKLL